MASRKIIPGKKDDQLENKDKETELDENDLDQVLGGVNFERSRTKPGKGGKAYLTGSDIPTNLR